MMSESFYSEFPSLAAKEAQLDADMSRIRSQIKEVETSERYADNESERKYQLAKLEEQKEQTLAEAEEDFQTELQATELHLAEQAFSLPQASEEERAQARSLTDTIRTQVVTSSNISDTLSLLEVRTKSMNDVEKQTLKSELASIVDSAMTKARNQDERADIQAQLDEIAANINDTVHSRNINEQVEALNKIKRGGGSLRRKYDAWDKALNKVNREKVYDVE